MWCRGQSGMNDPRYFEAGQPYQGGVALVGDGKTTRLTPGTVCTSPAISRAASEQTSQRTHHDGHAHRRRRSAAGKSTAINALKHTAIDSNARLATNHLWRGRLAHMSTSSVGVRATSYTQLYNRTFFTSTTFFVLRVQNKFPNLITLTPANPRFFQK